MPCHFSIKSIILRPGTHSALLGIMTVAKFEIIGVPALGPLPPPSEMVGGGGSLFKTINYKVRTVDLAGSS